MSCEKNYLRQLTLAILLASMLLLVGLTGCAKRVVLYPITNKDFARIKQGEPSPIDGYVMSEFYLNEVLQAKIESK